jgi:hypothetical protein
MPSKENTVQKETAKSLKKFGSYACILIFALLKKGV